MSRFKSRKRSNRSRKTYGGDWEQFWNAIKGRMEIVPRNASASANAAKKAEADARAVDESMKAIEIAEKELSDITANVGQLETQVADLKQLQEAADAAAAQAASEKANANAAAAAAKAAANGLNANSAQKTKAAENATAALEAAKAKNANSTAKKAEAVAKLAELEQLVAETSAAAEAATRDSTAATEAAAAAMKAKAEADAAFVVAAASSERLKGNANAKTAAATKAKEDAEAKAKAAAEANARKVAAEKKKQEAEETRDKAIAEAKELLKAANAAANTVRNSAAAAASTRLANQMNQSIAEGLASQRHKSVTNVIGTVIPSNLPAGDKLTENQQKAMKASLERSQNMAAASKAVANVPSPTASAPSSATVSPRAGITPEQQAAYAARLPNQFKSLQTRRELGVRRGGRRVRTHKKRHARKTLRK